MLVNCGIPTQVMQGIQSLKSIQKFACKVCLKQWNLDYDNMLQLLDSPQLRINSLIISEAHYCV